MAPQPSFSALAKNSGLPGTIDSGASTYGRIVSFGGEPQAVSPASASDALINFKNERRLIGPMKPAAWRGNSRRRSS